MINASHKNRAVHVPGNSGGAPPPIAKARRAVTYLKIICTYKYNIMFFPLDWGYLSEGRTGIMRDINTSSPVNVIDPPIHP